MSCLMSLGKWSSMATRKAKPASRPVVVTTSHRGVFFGNAEDTTGATIRLTNARNCISWAASIGGVLGLAATGPDRNCRIGATAPGITLRDITCVMECSPQAARAWTEAPCVS
jgi:hypothetical protein